MQQIQVATDTIAAEKSYFSKEDDCLQLGEAGDLPSNIGRHSVTMENAICFIAAW